jgi:hypothetical protein
VAQIIDKKWADGVGFAYRPWTLNDANADFVLENVTVLNVANDKAFYIPLATEYGYLRGKGVKELEDKSKYPDGQGMTFKSVTLRHCTVNGVARKDNAKIQGAHTDGLYINGDPAIKFAKTDFLLEDFTVRNCDGSCMPILVQNPTRLGTFTLRRVLFEDSVVQKRLVLKRGVEIDVLQFENCGSINISPDDDTVRVGSVYIVNSPGVNVKNLIALFPNIPVFIDGKRFNGGVADSQPVAPKPPEVVTVPIVTPAVVTRNIVKLIAVYDDGTSEEFKK